MWGVEAAFSANIEGLCALRQDCYWLFNGGRPDASSCCKVAPCPEREKNTFLLIDEMYIHEDLVYDKHRGISYILST